jgi:hypothetical protein
MLRMVKMVKNDNKFQKMKERLKTPSIPKNAKK